MYLFFFFQPELTVYNFGSLYAKKQPFAILFDTDIRIGKGGHKILMKVIRSNECKDFTFVWMDLWVSRNTAVAASSGAPISNRNSL